MQLTVILNVGHDPILLETRSIVLRSAGYKVESAWSVKEAATKFLAGDFDGVILCHSIPAKDRDRLSCLIRASGSLTPVIAVSASSRQRDSFADAIIEHDLKGLLRGIKEAVETPAKLSGGAVPVNNAIAMRFEGKVWCKTILCVDDDPGVLAIRRALLENAGYLVLTTHDGPEGLKIYSTGIVDAVILDYEMPIMSGGVVATQMLRIKGDVPLILVSGSTIPQDDLTLFNRFIPKGGHPKQLLSAIGEVLSGDHAQTVERRKAQSSQTVSVVHYATE
jgi:CheY-like chemotaxis protein